LFFQIVVWCILRQQRAEIHSVHRGLQAQLKSAVPFHVARCGVFEFGARSWLPEFFPEPLYTTCTSANVLFVVRVTLGAMFAADLTVAAIAATAMV
jgi:hypothetical protein